MRRSKKLLSMLLSILMILSTMSVTGTVAFAKDINKNLYVYTSDMEKAFSVSQEDNKIVFGDVIITITGDGSIHYEDDIGLIFEGDDATFTISLKDGYDISWVFFRSYKNYVKVIGDNWETSNSSMSNYSKWNSNIEKGINPQKAISFTAVEGSVKEINVYYTIHEHEFVDYVCECGEEDLANAKKYALLEIQFASTKANSEATEAGRKAVNDATTVAEVTKAKEDALVAMYAMDLAYTKEYLLSAMEEWLVENPLDYEENQGIYDEAVAAVKVATTIEDAEHQYYEYMIMYNHAFNEELNDIFDEAFPEEEEPEDVAEVRMRALSEIMHNIPEDIIGKKAIARAVVDYVNAAVAAYLNSTEAEKELYWAKVAALEEIEDAQYEASTYDVDDVSTDPVKNATSLEEVETAKDAIIAEIAAIDKAFNDAMEEAIQDIIDAAGTNPSEAVQEIVEDALYELGYHSYRMRDILQVKEKALADIKAQIESEQPVKTLDEVKTEAIAEINTAKTEANADIAEKAITDIGAATTVEAVNTIKTQALSDMTAADAAAEAAKALADAKTAAIAEINTAKTEANAEIAEQAITDINAATTVEDVNTIKAQALSDMAAADAAAAAAKALADAKTAAIAEINTAKTEANKEFAENAITEIGAATTVEDVNNIKAQALINMEQADIDAAAAKALADAKTAAIAAINTAKTEANAEIAENAVTAINAATTAEDVNTIKTQALSDMAAADVAAEAAKALADAKTAAIAEINTAKTEANKEFAENAITEIGAATTVEDVNTIKTQALNDMAAADAAAAAAKALADAKTASIAEINTAKTEANTSIAEDAIVHINVATTVEDVNNIKAQALINMEQADIDAAAAKALADAKTAAISEINTAKTEANASIAEDAIVHINAATTVEDVNNIKAQALINMEQADIDAATAKALADAKTAAIAAINTAKTEANAEIAENAVTAINAAITAEDVNTIKTQALSNMAAADAAAEAAKALADAKTAAIADINTAKTEANAEIAENAITDIGAATTVEAVNTIKTQALSDMAAADAAAEALAEAKDAALEAVDEAKNNAISDEAKEVSTEAILNATTLEEVATAKQAVLDAINLADQNLEDAQTTAIRNIENKKTIAVSDAAKAITIDKISEATSILAVNAAEAELSAEIDAAEKALADAKTAAMAKIEAAAGKKSARSEKLQKEVDSCIFMINLSKTPERVDEVLESSLRFIATQIKRDAAIAEVKTVCGSKPSAAVKALFDEFCGLVEYATDDEIDSLKAEYIAKIAAQIENEKTEDPTEPEEPDNGLCRKPVSGICFTYNKYLKTPVINVILKAFHAIVHFFHGDF